MLARPLEMRSSPQAIATHGTIAFVMAMMAKETVVVMSEILMAPKVAIPETAIIMTQKRNVIAAARTQRPIMRSESASESGCP